MNTIRDLIDTAVPLGFTYFYGLENNEGYLRRLLRNAPTLEELYSILRSDIDFFTEIDEGFFANSRQFKNFRKLKKYIIEARRIITELLQKKKESSKWEQEQVRKEIKKLDKELRDGLIDKEEYDYSIKMLLRPTRDDLEEVRNKFIEIDQKVKQELKGVDIDFDEEEERELTPDEEVSLALELEKESVDINKLVDDKIRRYSMQEFNDLYEDMNQTFTSAPKPNQQKKADIPDPKAKQMANKEMILNKQRKVNILKNNPNIKPADLDKMTTEQLMALNNE